MAVSIEWKNIQSNGIYFKSIGKLSQTKGNITTLINIDLNEIEVQITVIQIYIPNINEDCTINIPNCVEFLKKSRIEINNLRKNLGTIYQLLGVDRRTKRGLISFIGPGLKVLFGTLDNEDAEY